MIRPQHHTLARARLVPAALALGLGTAVVLGGCSTGQSTQTDAQVAAVNGATTEQNDIAVRDVQFTFPKTGSSYPQGSSAPVQAALINSGSEDDRLVRVSSPYAKSGQVSGDTELAQNESLHAYGEQSPGADNSNYTQPSSNDDQREVVITLNDLEQDIGAGVTVPVTFTFAKAGDITLQVPIGQDHQPRPDSGSPRPE